MKHFNQMTARERRINEIARRVYLPICQFEIYNELNVFEKEVLDVGIAEDIEAFRKQALKRNLSIDETKTEFDWLLGNGYQNIMRLAEFRHVLPTELVLEFALKFNLIGGKPEHDRLLKEFVGEDHVALGAFIRYSSNKLLLNGIKLCAVRSNKTSKIHHILFSFQERGWQEKRIDFAGTYEAKQVADAVRALNAKQDEIRFSVFDYTSVEFKVRAVNLV